MPVTTTTVTTRSTTSSPGVAVHTIRYVNSSRCASGFVHVQCWPAFPPTTGTNGRLPFHEACNQFQFQTLSLLWLLSGVASGSDMCAKSPKLGYLSCGTCWLCSKNAKELAMMTNCETCNGPRRILWVQGGVPAGRPTAPVRHSWEQIFCSERLCECQKTNEHGIAGHAARMLANSPTAGALHRKAKFWFWVSFCNQVRSDESRRSVSAQMCTNSDSKNCNPEFNWFFAWRWPVLFRRISVLMLFSVFVRLKFAFNISHHSSTTRSFAEFLYEDRIHFPMMPFYLRSKKL